MPRYKPPKIYCNDKGQMLGRLYFEGRKKIYRKIVQMSKHLLRVMDAWGIDADIVRSLELNKCTEIRIKCSETDIVYMISFKKFKEIGVMRNFVGEQIFVPRKYWKIKK